MNKRSWKRREGHWESVTWVYPLPHLLLKGGLIWWASQSSARGGGGVWGGGGAARASRKGTRVCGDRECLTPGGRPAHLLFDESCCCQSGKGSWSRAAGTALGQAEPGGSVWVLGCWGGWDTGDPRGGAQKPAAGDQQESSLVGGVMEDQRRDHRASAPCPQHGEAAALTWPDFVLLGGPRSAFGFLSKNKRHSFHFHQELYGTTYSPFCSTTFCHFSGNLIIPSSQNVLSFWATNCSRCFLQSSRELKFSPLREFCKDWNKWKSEGAMSGEYGRWIRTSQPSCNSFCLVIKKHVALRYPDGRLCVFCWLILDAFCWVLLSVGLIGSSTCWNYSFGFLERAHNRGLPIPPYTHHLLWMKIGLWCGWWWVISLAPRSLPFHIVVQYPLFIAHHNWF